jgi:hypothetical protein
MISRLYDRKMQWDDIPVPQGHPGSRRRSLGPAGLGVRACAGAGPAHSGQERIIDVNYAWLVCRPTETMRALTERAATNSPAAAEAGRPARLKRHSQE